MKYEIMEKKVNEKEAKEYVDKLWGEGTFEQRV